MPAHRKHPPQNAASEIERLALHGHSTTGVAKFFNVARSTVKRWFEEDERLEEAYERGRDAYRQALEEQIVAMSLAGKNCGGLIFLMKAKFGFFDVPTPNTKVDVAVAVAPVMVVRDHGSDESWAAAAAEQQRKLMEGDSKPAVALAGPSVPTALPEPTRVPCSVPATTAKQWEAPAWKQNA